MSHSKSLSLFLALVLLGYAPAAFAHRGGDDNSGSSGRGRDHAEDSSDDSDDDSRRGRGSDDQNDDSSGRSDDSKGRGSDDSSSSRDDSKNGSDRSKTRIKARLAGDGVVVFAYGKIEYRAETKKNKSETKFKIKVEIPLPSTVPPVADEAQAAALGLVARLSRAGAEYAMCTFEFDHLENEDDDDDSAQLRAEYKVDLQAKTKKGTLSTRSKKGGCVETGTTNAVIPALTSGDVVQVNYIDGAGEVALVNGTIK